MVSTGDDEEVANDAIQLLTIANFNGLCRLIAALSRNGFVSADQVDDIHDAMTLPLDDPKWRDYSFISSTREALDRVLAKAQHEAST